MQSGIYKITSPTGRIYIGQSVDIKRRIWNYKCLNCSDQPKIYNSLIKHGVEYHVFEIIEYCSIAELNSKETHYIKLFNSDSEFNLNCSPGGLGCRHSEETKNKIRIALTGNKNTLGYKYTDERKKQQSERTKGKPGNKGRKDTDEIRAMKSKRAMGNQYFLGRKHSEETKAKMREAAIRLNTINNIRKWEPLSASTGTSRT